MNRTALIVSLSCLALGLAAGLALGWLVLPPPVDSSPKSLQQPYKDDAVLMIAARYALEQDATLARAELKTLGFDDPAVAIKDSAPRLLAKPLNDADRRRLARLAQAFNAVTPELQPYLP